MTLLGSERPKGKPPQGRQYLDSFVYQVHKLLDAAYARMTPGDLVHKQEPAITGLLAAAMREVIEGPNRLEWAWRYAVHDDPPVETVEREGKGRSRIDIEVERTEKGKHPRFQFEAKRLYRGDSVAEYVDDEGLVAFVAGEYAANHDDAGMLGYVQAKDVAAWVGSITKKLETDPLSYGLSENVPVWREITFKGSRLSSYESIHRRVSPGPLRIVHTFLLCC